MHAPREVHLRMKKARRELQLEDEQMWCVHLFRLSGLCADCSHEAVDAQKRSRAPSFPRDMGHMM